MSYLDRIRECNQHNLAHFRPLYVAKQLVGWLSHDFAEELRSWPELFVIATDVVKVTVQEKQAGLTDFKSRTGALKIVNESLVRKGVIKQTHGEHYPVKSQFQEPPLLVIDRASASYYGIKAWGQHLNGYVRKRGEIYMWIARRARDKRTFPGMLDNMVAGGLPYNISLRENIAKECSEEASVPEALLAPLKSVGAISYCAETNEGLKSDILFCYDLELPESFQPVCQDGEVEEFSLLPLAEVASIVRETNSFKPNCDLTIIDFLIRHGVIKPDDKDYFDIVCGLRTPLRFESWLD